MTSKKLLKRLGADAIDPDFDALPASASHIQLTPYGELFDEIGEGQYSHIDPNAAACFSIVVAFADKPGCAIADFPSYEALKSAVLELDLLDGRRSVWWVDEILRFEVKNLEKLDKKLHKERGFPARRADVLDFRRRYRGWVMGLYDGEGGEKSERKRRREDLH